MLRAIELVMIRNKAIVEVVQPRVTYGAHKAAFVKYVIFYGYALKNFHWLAAFWLVTPVCPDY